MHTNYDIAISAVCAKKKNVSERVEVKRLKSNERIRKVRQGPSCVACVLHSGS